MKWQHSAPEILHSVIHMNGRIYDPQLGRMLQADPFIQAPGNTQSYNRYSYVMNNPLAYTDPSGYFLKELANVVVGVVRVWNAESFNPEAWARLAYDVVQLANALDGEFKSNPSSFNFSPGVAPGAFTNLTGPVQAGSGTANRVNPYTWDPTAESVIGATYSDITGGKFVNGAGSRTFSILIVGQPEEKRRRDDPRNLVTIETNQDALDHYTDGDGERANLGNRIKTALETHAEQLRRLNSIRTGQTSSLMVGNYGVPMRRKMYFVGDTRVSYQTSCGVLFCKTIFTGFESDGFWDPVIDIDGSGPMGEFGTPYEFVPHQWQVVFPNPQYPQR